MDAVELRRELERCHRRAHAWALHCCRWDPAAAEDVLQTAYLKVLDGRARFDGRSAFLTWLFAVIRHTAVDESRRSFLRFRRTAPLDEESARFSDEFDAAQHPTGEQEVPTRHLRLALMRLSPRQRDVLLLVFYHERTVEEAAGVMGIGVGSARTHYARGKERLRQLLEMPGEAHDG